MIKTPVEESEFRFPVKVASVTGQAKERDIALLWMVYGTGMMPIKLAKLTVANYLAADGSVRVESKVQAEMAFNGIARPLCVVAALDDYLAIRAQFDLGEPGQYRSLASDAPLVLALDGESFTFTRHKTYSGKDSFSLEFQTKIIWRIHTQAGIEAGSALRARRTLGVRRHRKGYDIRHVQTILEVQSLTAVTRMVEANPVRLGAIVARVI